MMSIRSRFSGVIFAFLVGLGTIAPGLEAGIFDYIPSLWKRTYHTRNRSLVDIAYSNGYIDNELIDQFMFLPPHILNPQCVVLLMIKNPHIRALTQAIIKSSDEYLIGKPRYEIQKNRYITKTVYRALHTKPIPLKEIVKNRLRDTLPEYLTKIIMMYIITHSLWISTKNGSWFTWALSFIGKTVCSTAMTYAFASTIHTIIPEKKETS